MWRKSIGGIYLIISGYLAFSILKVAFGWIFVSGWKPGTEISFFGSAVCLVAALALARISLKQYPNGMPAQSLIMIILPLVVIAPLALFIFLPFLSF